MFEEGIRATVEDLLRFDPAVCDRHELEQVVELSARVRGWVDAIDVAVARRVASSATPGFDASPAEVLGRRGRRAGRDAKAAADRAAVCDQMPAFEEALAAGTITAGHVDAVANATRGLDTAARSELATLAPDLLDTAAHATVAEFERDCRDLARLLAGDGGVGQLDRQKANSTVRRWIDRVTGMWHLHAEVDPETGAKLWAAVDARLATVRQRDGNAEIPLERLAVTALVETATSAPDSDADRRVPEVCVHVDYAWLREAAGEHGVCEVSNGVPLPVDTVRRLCCEAMIVPVVLGADGEALAVGRERRVATRAQRRALRAMYRTCAHPHCDVVFDYCQIHHVIPWEQFGRTDLDNLLPLCTAHHHQVHEGRWRLTLGADRTITLHRPDGTRYFTGPTIDRGPAHQPANRHARAGPGRARSGPTLPTAGDSVAA